MPVPSHVLGRAVRAACLASAEVVVHKLCVLLLLCSAAGCCSILDLVGSAWTFGAEEKRLGHMDREEMPSRESPILCVWDVLRTSSVASSSLRNAFHSQTFAFLGPLPSLVIGGAAKRALCGLCLESF